MPDFVNYNKRDVSLPPGCKDLIAVLAATEKTKLLEQWNRANPQVHSSMGPITDIIKHVHTLYASPASCFNLWIMSIKPQIVVTVWKDFLSLVSASVEVKENSDEEHAVVLFYVKRGLRQSTEFPSWFTPNPNNPSCSFCYLSPLPSNFTEVALLIQDLLRDVGLTEEMELFYQYEEKSGIFHT
jgi:hypothetical protein